MTKVQRKLGIAQLLEGETRSLPGYTVIWSHLGKPYQRRNRKRRWSKKKKEGERKQEQQESGREGRREKK